MSKKEPSLSSEQKTDKKMTIYEYEDKYVRRENARGARIVLRLIASIIGVFLFACLLLVTLRVAEWHEHAGYTVGVICLLVFIFLFLVPIIKLFKTEYFQTNVNDQTASKAKAHNRKLRHKIASHFIEINASVDGVGWYDSKLVGELAIALHQKDEKGIKEKLTALYAKSVKKSARDIISKSALKSGTYSALSQSEKLDTALITVINLQMIKDIVFLYGFRPSDAKLAKIFVKVVQNSLIAYGLGSMNIGNGVVRTVGGALKSIPLLGSIVSTLVDSSVQGMANAGLTAIIGYQTIRYLNREYKLQDILDGIELESASELMETCEEVESELKRVGKKHSATKKPVTA